MADQVTPPKEHQSLAEERLRVEGAFAHGMTQMLEPLAAQHTEAVLTVQQDQAELSQTLDVLKKKLEEALQYSQLPQVGAYLQKLNEVKRRVASLTTKLNLTSERLSRTHRQAQAQHGALKASSDAQQAEVNKWLTNTEVKISQLPDVSGDMGAKASKGIPEETKAPQGATPAPAAAAPAAGDAKAPEAATEAAAAAPSPSDAAAETAAPETAAAAATPATATPERDDVLLDEAPSPAEPTEEGKGEPEPSGREESAAAADGVAAAAPEEPSQTEAAPEEGVGEGSQAEAVGGGD